VTIPVPSRWLITLSFAVLLIVLSVTPGDSQKDDSIFAWLVVSTPTLVQKIMHVTAYAALAFLLAWTLDNIEPKVARMVTTFVLAVSLGIALEWYQTIVPGRFGTLFDILLNSLGVVAGLIAATLLLDDIRLDL
jgi:glycopeptide antibiotics resistance protein